MHQILFCDARVPTLVLCVFPYLWLLQDDCAITPVISESSANFIEGLVKDAEQKGATLCQKYKRENNLIWPVLIDHVTAVCLILPLLSSCACFCKLFLLSVLLLRPLCIFVCAPSCSGGVTARSCLLNTMCFCARSLPSASRGVLKHHAQTAQGLCVLCILTDKSVQGATRMAMLMCFGCHSTWPGPLCGQPEQRV